MKEFIENLVNGDSYQMVCTVQAPAVTSEAPSERRSAERATAKRIRPARP